MIIGYAVKYPSGRIEFYKCHEIEARRMKDKFDSLGDKYKTKLVECDRSGKYDSRLDKHLVRKK